jgi:hypothetical protein
MNPINTVFPEMFENLKIIATIPEGYKLCIDKHNQLAIQAPSMFGGVSRMISGDNRGTCIDHAEKFIIQGLSLLLIVVESKYINQHFRQMKGDDPIILNLHIERMKRLEEMMQLLLDVKSGLDNLRITYINDEKTCNRIKSICDRIDEEISIHSAYIMEEQGNISICGQTIDKLAK